MTLKKIALFTGTLLLCLPFLAFSNEETGKDSLNYSQLYISSPFPHADPMLARIDSLTAFAFSKNNLYFGNVSTVSTPFDPQYSDAEIKRKLNQIPTLFPMNYNNDVKTYINYFTQTKRGYTSRMLGLCEIYFPMFEELLEQRKMPIELKYLPVIESAFNPSAVSRCGATGMWQIMYKTGRVLGMNMNSYIDERMDPRVSTMAALDYLQQLYNIYGDWQLALAAYNAGPGNVNKAIANAGGIKNFWAVKPFLPMETQNYVPSFIGMVYAMNYSKDYKINATMPVFNPTLIDTVIIKDHVSLKHISNTVGIPMEELQFLNPSLKLGVIPSSENGFSLRLPVGYLARFETNRATILNDPTLVATNDENAEEITVFESVPKLLTHIVRSGESITSLARKYACTVTDIKRWNHLKSTSLHKGQHVNIKTVTTQKVTKSVPAGTSSSIIKPEGTAYTNSGSVNQTAKTVATEESYVNVAKTLYHSVRKGESVGSIASKYHCTVSELKSWNRLRNSYIYPGQKLAIKTTVSQKVSKPVESSRVEESSSTTVGSESGKVQPTTGIKYVLHTVQKGETLYSISQLYQGATIESIKSLNNISTDELRPGAVLKIQI
jgi:membrane-bound lytic murein transglycosylase D